MFEDPLPIHARGGVAALTDGFPTVTSHAVGLATIKGDCPALQHAATLSGVLARERKKRANVPPTLSSTPEALRVQPEPRFWAPSWGAERPGASDDLAGRSRRLVWRNLKRNSAPEIQLLT